MLSGHVHDQAETEPARVQLWHDGTLRRALLAPPARQVSQTRQKQAYTGFALRHKQENFGTLRKNLITVKSRFLAKKCEEVGRRGAVRAHS